MEDWFQSQEILEEDKPSYAEETITGEAFNNWEIEEAIRIDYNGPCYNWGDMKTLIYREFMENAPAQYHHYLKSVPHAKPKRWIQAAKPSPKVVCKHAYHSKKVSTNTLVKLQEPQEAAQRKLHHGLNQTLLRKS